MPDNTSIKVAKNYFVAFFNGKKAKNEVFQYNFNDSFFDEFFVENIDNGSRIIIKTKRGYVPAFKSDNKTITIRAILKPKKRVSNGRSYGKIPSNLIAVPFYSSPSIFKKSGQNGEVSYDETLFFTGVKFFANKNYTYARQFFKEIIDKYKSSDFYVSSYFLLGDCYKNMNQNQKALDTYKQAIALSPKNDTVAQTLFSMADIYKNMKFYFQARSIYKSVAKDYANTKWGELARYLLAKSYYDEKRFNKALNLLLNIDKSNRYYSLGMLLAAEIFIKQKNDAKAVLAYYSMSNNLRSIDISKYYRELIDVAEALCRFNDYKGAKEIFSYVGESDYTVILENLYIGQMKCDIDRGDYGDLNKKADYLIKNSKNKKIVKEAKKLLDEEKLEQGNIGKDAINRILDKYANDPEIASLALYVFAKKNYRDNNYEEAANYLLKLKKLYPASIYNKKAEPMAINSINRLLNDFYLYPDKEKLDFIYDKTVGLNAYKADMCRLCLALSVMREIDRMKDILPYIKNKNCKGALYAKYYIEKGEDKKAIEFAGNIESEKPYIYYVDIAIGDINYFKGSYDKAVEFYKQALGVDNKLVKNYAYLRIADTLYTDKKYVDSMSYLKHVKIKAYQNKAEYLKAMDLYNIGRYEAAIKLFKGLSNSLKYQELSLFYAAVSSIKLNKEKNAEKYFKKLKNAYPNSEYIKALKALLQ